MDDVGTAEAARILHVSAPTVRAWARAGVIAGALVDRGDRQVWRLDRASVEAHAATLAQQAHSQVSLAGLGERVAALEAAVETAQAKTGAASAGFSTLDALTLRAVVDEQAAADEARAGVVEHLLAALRASEDADTHRRAAIAAAQTALGYNLVPDDPSSATAEVQR